METALFDKTLSVIEKMAEAMGAKVETADSVCGVRIDGNRILIGKTLKIDNSSVREIANCFSRLLIGGDDDISGLSGDDPIRIRHETMISRIGGAIVLAIVTAINQTHKEIDEAIDNPIGKLRVNGMKISPGMGKYLTISEITLINSILERASKRRGKRR